MELCDAYHAVRDVLVLILCLAYVYQTIVLLFDLNGYFSEFHARVIAFVVVVCLTVIELCCM